MAHLWVDVKKGADKAKLLGMLNPPTGRVRKCEKCGAVQSYGLTSWSVMSGGTWAWHPLVGRCSADRKEKKHDEPPRR